jgi:hypothetical protein
MLYLNELECKSAHEGRVGTEAEEQANKLIIIECKLTDHDVDVVVVVVVGDDANKREGYVKVKVVMERQRRLRGERRRKANERVS